MLVARSCGEDAVRTVNIQEANRLVPLDLQHSSSYHVFARKNQACVDGVAHTLLEALKGLLGHLCGCNGQAELQLPHGFLLSVDLEADVKTAHSIPEQPAERP